MRLIFATIGLILFAESLAAQNPGQHVQVIVTPVLTTIRADTAGVTLTVRSGTASTENLSTFLIDAPGHVLRISTPSPAMSWSTDSLWAGQPKALWIILALLPPGSTTPQLYFESVGLPGILTYWAGGDFPPPMVDDANDGKPAPDLLATEMINGKTVGVEPWPSDRTAKGLLARLRSLTQSSCGSPLLWITSSTLCTKLIGYVDQAETYRASGKTTQAKSSLNSYISALSGKTSGTFATGVTASGYWLLQPNANIVISKL
jgi:hypothetical protein